MNFLYPQFLYGLFALAIPILIHLFNFRRTKKVFFSNTQFLKKVKEASSSKRKLKHYLILLARLLFIFFLVMAFAQPILKSSEEAETKSDLLVYFDNSYSMSNEVREGISALNEASAYLDELVKLFPPSTQYQLLTNDFDPASTVSKSKVEINDLTTELNYSSVPRSFEEIKNRIDASAAATQSIFWISDFQKSTSNKSTISFDSTVNVNLVPVQFNSYQNIAVDSVWLENPFLIGQENLKLHVKLRNYGLSTFENLIVKVFIDDVQSATASLNIPPNLSQEAVFDLAFNLKNINECRISFEDFPVTFDNDFYFTLSGGQKINVLEIKNTDNITTVERVYGNQSIFNFSSVDVSNLDYSLLKSNDFVVVNQVAQIDASLGIAINEYLENSGHILLIPSTEPEIETYRQLVGLQRLRLNYDTLQKRELKTPDFNNPFFKNIFEEEVDNFAMPWSKPIVSWGNDRTALLSFQNGSPFLSSQGIENNIFIMASPLQSRLTSFYSHALFVPVMYRLAMQSTSGQNQLYYLTNSESIIYNTKIDMGDNILKLRSGDKEIIPSQRLIGTQVVMEVPKNSIDAGFYDLTVGDSTLTKFAFNRSFAESDLVQYQYGELSSLFEGDVTIFDVNSSTGFSKEVEKKYIGEALWKYAIVLSLLFLLIEILLIRFFP